MKKIIVLMLVAVGMVAVSCKPAVEDVEPIVTFYMDNEEITGNSIEVPLNSYRAGSSIFQNQDGGNRNQFQPWGLLLLAIRHGISR